MESKKLVLKLFIDALKGKYGLRSPARQNIEKYSGFDAHFDGIVQDISV